MKQSRKKQAVIATLAEPAVWSLRHDFLTRRALRVAVVGVGGTGSEVLSLLTHLHLALRANGYGGLDVCAFDPDTVSQANLVRQRFAPDDLGRNKASVLVNRINLACGLDWTAGPHAFTSRYATATWDLVVSSVDTRKARAMLHKYAYAQHMYRWHLWLDLGNDVDTGQAILGTPRRETLEHHLPCATEIHPELRNTRLPDDNTPSCSSLEALRRQDLFVNKQVALLGVDLLWTLFRERELRTHGRYFKMHPAYHVQDLPVPAKRPRRLAAPVAAAA